MKIISSEPKKLSNPTEKRRKKGVQIFQSGNVVSMNKEGTDFKVKSQSKDGGWYKVRWSPDLKLGTCTCHDYAYGGDIECKHITASRYMRHEMGYAC